MVTIVVVVMVLAALTAQKQEAIRASSNQCVVRILYHTEQTCKTSPVLHVMSVCAACVLSFFHSLQPDVQPEKSSKTEGAEGP